VAYVLSKKEIFYRNDFLVMLKFVHMADIHLGYRQYNCEERLIDFAQAFLDAVKFAIEKKVDFILIAGDLFHKKNEIDPLTLTQATKILEKAKKSGIPVIAVEGNHDSTYFRESFSWLDYLSKSGLIINLKPSFDEGEMVIDEWDGESGAYVDLDCARIYGMKYYGSLSEKILEEYRKRIRRRDFTIFMAHVGVEGYMDIYGCVNPSKLYMLRERVDYIALGHIHRSFVENDFIFNPGSLETCDISELKFDRGFFYVEVEDEIRYDLIRNRRRDFVVLRYELKDLDYDGFRRFLKSKKSGKKPVVDLTLSVSKSIRREVDEDRIKRIVNEVFDPLLVRLKWELYDSFFTAKRIDTESRESIEKSVIGDLLRSLKYGDIVDEVISLKNVFSSNFKIELVDRFIEDIIRGFKEEKVEKESTDEEEVWDWRKAYDKGIKTRKR